MTHENKGHFSKKHSPDRKVNARVSTHITTKVTGGAMACAVAFEIAESLAVSPEEVGFTLDSLEVKVVKCQLGLFGYGGSRKSHTRGPDEGPPALLLCLGSGR